MLCVFGAVCGDDAFPNEIATVVGRQVGTKYGYSMQGGEVFWYTKTETHLSSEMLM